MSYPEPRLTSFEHHGNNIRFTALMPDGDELNCELDVDKLVSTQGPIGFNDFMYKFMFSVALAIREGQQLHQHPG